MGDAKGGGDGGRRGAVGAQLYIYICTHIDIDMLSMCKCRYIKRRKCTDKYIHTYTYVYIYMYKCVKTRRKSVYVCGHIDTHMSGQDSHEAAASKKCVRSTCSATP